MPNDLSGDGYVELLAHPDGTTHFGVWTALLMVASRTRPRGALVREGRPHDSESLARMMRQPETVVRAAIERLLQIGLLEADSGKSRNNKRLPQHPGAPRQHRAATKSREGALEQKGTEHHHQEGNRTKKKGTRTEPEGTERAREELKAEGSRACVSTAAASSQKGDDADGKPGIAYASSEDELKAIYLSKTGEPITAELLHVIGANLELSGVSLVDFIVEVRKHTQNAWRNTPGFLRDLSKRFRTKTRQASAPLTVAEVSAKNYQCPVCHSKTPGEGAVLTAGKSVPCECASPEYIGRQRERGLFQPEATL
jgi:hypothetical protein